MNGDSIVDRITLRVKQGVRGYSCDILCSCEVIAFQTQSFIRCRSESRQVLCDLHILCEVSKCVCVYLACRKRSPMISHDKDLPCYHGNREGTVLPVTCYKGQRHLSMSQPLQSTVFLLDHNQRNTLLISIFN